MDVIKSLKCRLDTLHIDLFLFYAFHKVPVRCCVLLFISATSTLLLYIFFPTTVTPVFFSTIATSLAAILAITFSISLIAVQIISDKYTPYVLRYFKKDLLINLTLISFLTTIVLSVLFLLFPNVPQSGYVIWFAFLFCCLILILYFYRMLEIIDPIKLAHSLNSEGIDSVKKKNFNEFIKIIDSLSDIAIKEVRRNESSICNTYINQLFKLFEVHFRKYKNELQSEDAGIKTSRILNLWHILDRHSKIFKAVISEDEVEIAMNMVSRHQSLIEMIRRESSSKSLLEYMLNNIRQLQFSVDFQKQRDVIVISKGRVISTSAYKYQLLEQKLDELESLVNKYMNN